MALVGEMQYLTIGSNTYSLPSGGGGTVTSVAVSNATNGGLSISGSPVTSSGTITIGHSNVLTSAQSTQAVYPITIDKNGHIASYGNAVTIPSEELGIVALYDDTYSDISAAYNNYKYIIGYDGEGPMYLPLEKIEGGFTFTGIHKNGNDLFATEYTISSSGVWSNSSIRVDYMKWTASSSTNTYYPLVSSSASNTFTASTLNGINFYQYYNTAGGYRRLELGNTTAYKSTGGAYGAIRLYGAAATYYGDLVPGTLGTTSGDGHISANRTWTLPDATGTIALTSDIPTVTDEKLKTGSITSGTTYFPVVGSSSISAETKKVDLTGLAYVGTSGTSSADGSSILILGNATASGTSGNKEGRIRLWGTGDDSALLVAGALTDTRTITLPDASGTIALTSDISGKVDKTYTYTDIDDTSGTQTIFNGLEDDGEELWNRLYLNHTAQYTHNNTDYTNDNYIELGAGSISISSTRMQSNNDSDYSESYMNIMPKEIVLGYIDSDGRHNSIGLEQLNNNLCAFINTDTLELGGGSYVYSIDCSSPTVNRTLTLPDASGTIALTSDIPTVPTNWLNGSATGSVRTSGSRAEGTSYTMGQYAVAEGWYTMATGRAAHAEGIGYDDAVLASGDASHAEGEDTVASGEASHAEGYITTASAFTAHAEGSSTLASANNAHAQNLGTVATQRAQTTIGTYNLQDTTPSSAVHPGGSTTYGNYAFIIGNGSSSSTRSNAFAVKWDGTVETAQGNLSGVQIVRW